MALVYGFEGFTILVKLALGNENSLLKSVSLRLIL
jgi:hypothetical protein